MPWYLFLFLCFFITFTTSIDDQARVITGDVSINCGSTGISVVGGGREWIGDKHPIFTSLLQITGTSTVSTVVRSSISDDPIPYRTARISRSAFSYSFLVNPGQKFIRIHFNPAPYKGFKRLKDFFSVKAGPFILLSNFSASLTADSLGLSSFTKEFCISIQDNKPLNIIFSPAIGQQSQDTYAFVNGIEIIPVPSGHSYFHDGGNVGAQVVGQESQRVYIDGSTALEMVHRLNVKQGGSDLSRDDMFGMWTTIPKGKQSLTNNITWKISVDVGFRYMLRLHFSELGLNSIAETDSVILKVLIKEVVAYTNIYVVKPRDNNEVVIMYRDYMVTVKGLKQEGKLDLLISLLSHDGFMDGHGGPLTGFEVFKLSNTDNSLASLNPWPSARDSPSSTIKTLLSIVGQRNAIATVAITIIALVNVTVHKLREIWEATRTEEENNPSARAERFCRRFSLAEIELATRNFSDSHIIGKGGFGRVYKGIIDNGRETVAIKRLKAHSRQGAREFLAEIETLSELRHINLVSLIGYCNEQGEMIIVYEYMACGTLADHLYKLARNGSSCSSLTWKQRLDICIGAGRGLDYLHTGHAVIHRDVKVSNILLDENFTAKVSDFGLVKRENINNLQSHVSTKVKGTFGYLDPNYFRTGKLTRKSDTYSFGVVLLEVLCGRPALDSTVAKDEQILTKWAQDKISKGEVDLIVASSLREEASPDSLKAFVEVVSRCLDDDPKKRPTMAQVVLRLEFALDRQETTISLVTYKETCDAPCNDVPNEETSDAPCDDVPNEEASNAPCNDVPNEETSDASRNDETNFFDIVFRRKDGRKAMMDKPPRVWPWDSLWKRVKQPKKNEFSIAAKEKMGSEVANALSSTEEIQIYCGTTSSLVEEQARKEREELDKMVEEIRRKRVEEAQRRGAVELQRKEEERLRELELIQKQKEEATRRRRIEEEEHASQMTLLDGTRLCQLNWTQRFKIIMGIAQGILDIHRDSGSSIVHRNPKPSNGLLVMDMSPKIPNFVLPRSLIEYESSDDNVDAVAALAVTMGYISPESMQSGIFSTMSDVYTFGVVVLEIVSGKRNSCKFLGDDKGMNLVKCARKLWNDGKALEFVDELIKGSTEEVLSSCIRVGTLCTQEEPHNRPTMPEVLDMLRRRRFD